MSTGYRLSDLRAYGISPNPAGRSRPELATNGTVHSFWRQENFRLGTVEDDALTLPSNSSPQRDRRGMVPGDIYRRMLPALQLATSMLQVCSPFFQKILYAEIGDTVDADGSEIIIFDPDYAPSPSEAREYYDDLVEIDRYYRIFTGVSSTILHGYGDTRVLTDATGQIVSCLAAEFFQSFESPGYELLTAEALYSMWFMLAVTCVHQLAHTVLEGRDLADSVGRARRGEAKAPEPRFEESDPEAELGHAFEHYLFGGRLGFSGLPADLSGGLGVIWKPWEPKEWTSEADACFLEHEADIWMVTSRSIRRMFDHSTWVSARIARSLIFFELTPLRAMTTSIDEVPRNVFDQLYHTRLRSVRSNTHRPQNRPSRRSSDPTESPDRRRPPRDGRSLSPRSRLDTDFRSRSF